MAISKSDRRSIVAGAADAKRALDARAAARAAKVKKAMKALKAKGPAGPGSLTPGLAADVTAAPAPVLVAEGDSWFDYPFHDVLKVLEDDHGYDVESVARRGDRIEGMAYDGGQLDDFIRRLAKVLGRGGQIRAVLLSGGGNDIAGEEFGMLLNHAQSQSPGLNEKIVAGVLEDRIRPAYLWILGAVTKVCEELTGAKLPILVHGYDYPVPDGRGFLGGWGPFPGPWLDPGFSAKRYSRDDMKTRIATMKTLMDRFNDVVSGIAGGTGLEHVRFVDLRGTLKTGKDYEDWWANELHPTGDGYERVARKFAAVLAVV